LRKEDIQSVIRYMKVRKSYREYLLLRLIVETDINLMKLLSLKVGDVIGKTTYVDEKGVSYHIPKELANEIYTYCEFSQGDHYLFTSKNLKPLLRGQVWVMFKNTFSEFGFEKEYESIQQLRDIYKEGE